MRSCFGVRFIVHHPFGAAEGPRLNGRGLGPPGATGAGRKADARRGRTLCVTGTGEPPPVARRIRVVDAVRVVGFVGLGRQGGIGEADGAAEAEEQCALGAEGEGPGAEDIEPCAFGVRGVDRGGRQSGRLCGGLADEESERTRHTREPPALRITGSAVVAMFGASSAGTEHPDHLADEVAAGSESNKGRRRFHRQNLVSLHPMFARGALGLACSSELHAGSCQGVSSRMAEPDQFSPDLFGD